MGSGPVDVPSGAAIRAHRQRAGLSTAEYGRLLGVKRGTVENWEHERTTPRPSHVIGLIELLARAPEALAQLTPPPATEPEQRPSLRTCAEVIVVNGDHLWLLEIKASSCAGTDEFQRRLSAALKRDGLRVYREMPTNDDNDDSSEILLSS